MPNRGGDILANVPLFSELSKRHLKRVAELMEQERYHEGAIVVHEGEEGDSMYVLAEGQADVVRGGRTVDRLLPGDFFGEISLLTSRPRTATVTALTGVETLELTRASLESLRAAYPDLERILAESQRTRAQRTAEALIERRRRRP